MLPGGKKLRGQKRGKSDVNQTSEEGKDKKGIKSLKRRGLKNT